MRGAADVAQRREFGVVPIDEVRRGQPRIRCEDRDREPDTTVEQDPARHQCCTVCHSDAVATILVVDDEQSMREFLAIALRRAGYQVVFAQSGLEAIERLRTEPIDIVVTDLRMPGDFDGLGLLKAIKSGSVMRSPTPGSSSVPVDPEVILVTAFATTETAIAAMKQGAYDYLTKPFQIDEITAVIGRALEKRALVADNLALRDQLAGRVRLASLLGKSKAMQKVFELIGKIHST